MPHAVVGDPKSPRPKPDYVLIGAKSFEEFSFVLRRLSKRSWRPGEELEVVHPLHLLGIFPIPAADLTFPFIEGEPLQAKEGRIMYLPTRSAPVFVLARTGLCYELVRFYADLQKRK